MPYCMHRMLVLASVLPLVVSNNTVRTRWTEDAVVRPTTFGLLLGFETAPNQRLHFMCAVGPVCRERKRPLQRRFRQHEHSDGAGHRPEESRSPCHARLAPLPAEQASYVPVTSAPGPRGNTRNTLRGFVADGPRGARPPDSGTLAVWSRQVFRSTDFARAPVVQSTLPRCPCP